MNKDVLLSIRGLHFASSANASEPVEVITPAQYYLKNGKHYILYDEFDEDHTEVTKVTMKITDLSVEISKKGMVTTSMLFEKGQKNVSYYSTPFGSFMIGIVTDRIDFKEEESEFSLNIDYLLEANYEPVSDCSLEVHITDKDSGRFSLES